MSKHCRKHPIRVVRIDDDRTNLLSISQAEMLPGAASIRRFINSISNREIGPPQAFPAGYINDVGIRGRNRQRADTACGLIVENRVPRPSIVGALPYATVVGRHVENVWLIRYSRDRYSSSRAERPDESPLQLLKKRGVNLRTKCGAQKCDNDECTAVGSCHNSSKMMKDNKPGDSHQAGIQFLS